MNYLIMLINWLIMQVPYQYHMFRQCINWLNNYFINMLFNSLIMQVPYQYQMLKFH
jgi:hypothetical protein